MYVGGCGRMGGGPVDGTYDERGAERHEEEGELERELLAAAVPDPPEDDPAQGAHDEGAGKDGEGLDELRFLGPRGEEGVTCLVW